MYQAGQPTDMVAVAAHLAEAGTLGRVGGAPYLHTLMQAVPMTANAGHYAAIVAEHARRRAVVDLGERLTQLAGSGADTADVLAVGRILLADAPEPVWPAPIPLTARHTAPRFPVEVLPDWVADMVGAVAEFTQTPPDLAGCIALAALSTAAGGRAEVEVRGSWREPTNLFTVVVLPPGSRKSAVFAAIIGPLLGAERALVERTKPAIVEAELALRVAGKAAERAANAAAAADSGNRDRLLAEATAAAMNADSVTVPALPQLVADDVTSEQAASLLAEQGGRLAVLSPEGGIFATLAGRYSGTPNLEVFLKGHAGDMLRVDRRSRAGRAHRPPRADPRPGRTARGTTRHRTDARLPGQGPARPDPVRRTREHRWPPPHRRRPGTGRGRRGIRRQPRHAGAHRSPNGPTRPYSRSPPKPTNGC